MHEPSLQDQFLRSLELCADDPRFMSDFYDRFLSTSAEIRDKFRHTDMEAQKEMLLRSLRLSAGATAGDPESLRELKQRAETHNREHLNIEPILYDFWLNTIIQMASEYDPEWNSDVEHIWRTVLGHVVREMRNSY